MRQGDLAHGFCVLKLGHPGYTITHIGPIVVLVFGMVFKGTFPYLFLGTRMQMSYCKETVCCSHRYEPEEGQYLGIVHSQQQKSSEQIRYPMTREGGDQEKLSVTQEEHKRTEKLSSFYVSSIVEGEWERRRGN